MRIIRVPLMLFCTVLFVGCATMNKEDCLYADWQYNGYNDGSDGLDRDALQARRESCEKHGIIPDEQAYLEGYEDGLEKFCTVENGYDAGRRGHSYKNVCPDWLEGVFLAGYNEGRTIYVLESRLAEYRAAIDERAQQLDSLAYHNYRDENIMASKEATDLERQQALRRIRHRQRQAVFLRNELYNLNQQHTELTQQLMQLNPGRWSR